MKPKDKLGRALDRLRPQIAAAAQAIYDDWNRHPDDHDFEGDGICDEVSETIVGVVMEAIPDVETREGGWPGDDHAYPIFWDDKTAYAVDIPAYVYETGGGYRWKKRKGVTITADDVVIEPVERRYAAEEENPSQCTPAQHAQLKAERWAELPLKGTSQFADGTTLEYRDCPVCRSTLVKPVAGPEFEENPPKRYARSKPCSDEAHEAMAADPARWRKCELLYSKDDWGRGVEKRICRYCGATVEKQVADPVDNPPRRRKSPKSPKSPKEPPPPCPRCGRTEDTVEATNYGRPTGGWQHRCCGIATWPEENPTKPAGADYGVFVWRQDGHYPRANALATYARKGDAERRAEKMNQREMVHVVRTLYLSAARSS